VANKFQKTFCDVDENNFLIFLLCGQTRIERLRELVNALNRLVATVAVFVEDGVQVAIRLGLFDLVWEGCNVNYLLHTVHQGRRGLL